MSLHFQAQLQSGPQKTYFLLYFIAGTILNFLMAMRTASGPPPPQQPIKNTKKDQAPFLDFIVYFPQIFSSLQRVRSKKSIRLLQGRQSAGKLEMYLIHNLKVGSTC